MAMSETATVRHPLPTRFQSSPPETLTLITQGAEGLVYRTPFLSTTCALKYRPSKAYRHPTLDTRLTRHRILAEGRVLVRCRKEGVPVPAVLGLDWEAGWLALEWIDGRTIRSCLDEYLHTLDAGSEVPESQTELWDLMRRVGSAVGKMHSIGIIHGDLTTSNLMLKNPSSQGDVVKKLEGDVILIDFGLGVQTLQEEDRAVDIYVLERAFGSTHPQAEGLFHEVLKTYGETYKGAKGVLKRLEDVRQRGRKKSMLG